MNKSKIKSFAIEARSSLLRDVEKKLMHLNLDNVDKLPTKIDKGVEVADVSFTSGEKQDQRKNLIDRYNAIGKEQLIEEIAYTWFNRIIAIRFMEVNGFLKSGVRVLSAIDQDKNEPQIMTNLNSVKLPIDKELVYSLQDSGDHAGVFKYLFILQCNELNKDLPFLFEKIDSYSELLLPDNLLGVNSTISKLVETIQEDDFKNVEIIGWLYQYYVTERKDKLIKAKKKYKTNDIPPVTQLFTPHWIVKYMTQNSLGRYWIEAHPEHKDDLKENWDFFIENRDENSIEEIKKLKNSNLNIEDIKVYDPAMGSGHILVYAFEVLYQIYEILGYQKTDIPSLILQKNLFGLDIDARATQLARFALTMKARQYDKEILSKHITLNLFEIKSGDVLTNEEINTLSGNNSEKEDSLRKFIQQFEKAKDLGSIIKLENIDLDILEEALIHAQSSTQLFGQYALTKFKALVEQYKVMSQKYDVTIANPPYMGGKYMNLTLKSYVKENYPDTKSDLFAVFIEMMFATTKANGQLGIMSPFNWMFLKSYEKLREIIINKKTIQSLVKPSYTSFFESAIVSICTLVVRNKSIDIDGEFFDLGYLGNAEDQPILLKEAILNPKIDYRYTSSTKEFSKIPGSPIAYWASERVRKVFEKDTISSLNIYSQPGLQTSNNKVFIKNWTEVSLERIGFILTQKEASESEKKWFPYNKGGEYRKWYGNQDHIVNWYKNGQDIKSYVNAKYPYLKGNIDYVVKDRGYYFKEGLTYTKISSSAFGIRFFPKGQIFADAGSSIFPAKSLTNYLLGFLGTKLTWSFLQILNPTMNIQSGNVGDLPIIIINNNNYKKDIDNLVQNNINSSKNEWDSRETSWDFEGNSLIKHKSDSNLLFEAYKQFTEYCREQFFALHKNEEELNKIFIDIYGLSKEMDPDVELRNITILKEECTINETYLDEIRNRENIENIKGNISNQKLKSGLYPYFSNDDKQQLLQFNDEVIIKQFISYAVGCMFGRYSLDVQGLAFAGGEFDKGKYTTFKVDDDAIIPVLDDTYFEDDIVTRFVRFVLVTFGEDTLDKNLDFIATALGKTAKETSKERIRKYFSKDFYKDHVKMYKKKPIYWMFTSGKEKAFNALVYLHRYNDSIVAKLRTDYLHELQGKYDIELENKEVSLKNTDKASKKVKMEKQIKVLRKKVAELRTYDGLLRHEADKKIVLDLDDGVDVNYAKFENILAKK